MSRARTGIQKGGDSSNEDSVTRQSVSFKTRAVETVEIRGERERERETFPPVYKMAPGDRTPIDFTRTSSQQQPVTVVLIPVTGNETWCAENPSNRKEVAKNTRKRESWNNQKNKKKRTTAPGLSTLASAAKASQEDAAVRRFT